MKIKTSAKIKPKLRSKAAKIAFLKRSAAAKSVHHRRRIRKHALRHLAVVVGLILATLVTGGWVAAMASSLIPPPSPNINMAVYEQAIQAQQQAKPGVKPPDQVGVGSWYALGLANPDALTCASTKFPRGTYLEVKDLRNNQQMVCLVNDYGPAASTGRVIDLSRGSYRELEGLGSGTMPVEIRVVPAPTP
jgi:peptidoglycan lytic transglycosylase